MTEELYSNTVIILSIIFSIGIVLNTFHKAFISRRSCFKAYLQKKKFTKELKLEIEKELRR